MLGVPIYGIVETDPTSIQNTAMLFFSLSFLFFVCFLFVCFLIFLMKYTMFLSDHRCPITVVEKLYYQQNTKEWMVCNWIGLNINSFFLLIQLIISMLFISNPVLLKYIFFSIIKIMAPMFKGSAPSLYNLIG